MAPRHDPDKAGKAAVRDPPPDAPVVYTTAEDGTVICMVPCTHHTHVASGVTADEMNDLWRASPPQRPPHRLPCNTAGCTLSQIRDPTTREESVYIMPTAKSNTARRKAPQNAQERPAAQAIQFPLPYTKPRQTAPQEVQVVVCECSPDAVRVRCLPDPAAIVRMMDDTFGLWAGHAAITSRMAASGAAWACITR